MGAMNGERENARSAAKKGNVEQPEDNHINFLPLKDEDRHPRMIERLKWRQQLYKIPLGTFFEIPGRPHVCYCVRHYGHAEHGTKAEGAQRAREDFAYMFKAFESGQTPPHRLRKQEGMDRQPTIHEYLNWTVTAAEGQEPDDTCFAGFRVVLLFQRHRPEYPPPDAYDTGPASALDGLGADKPPLPRMMTKGTKPLSVATVRCGKDYLEVPFFATNDNHRGKGYGRCLLEALEQIGRRLNMKRFLLCSTDDEDVRNMWLAVGFQFTSEDDYRRWDIRSGDLIYMTNTVQMHKEMPPERKFRSVCLKHGAYAQRIYAPLDMPKGRGLQVLRECELAKKRGKRIAPAKSMPNGKVAKVAGAVQANSYGTSAALSAQS